MIKPESNFALERTEQNSPALNQQQLVANRFRQDVMPESFEKNAMAIASPSWDYRSSVLARWDSNVGGQTSHSQRSANRPEESKVPSQEQNIGPTRPEQGVVSTIPEGSGRVEQNGSTRLEQSGNTRLEQNIGQKSGGQNEGGRAFLGRLGGNVDYPRQNGVRGAAREQAILLEVERGNVPEFLSHFKRVVLHDKKGNTIELDVMPDYFAVGNDRDFVRMPMTPRLAKHIGDKLGLALPTEKVVDAIYRKADVKLQATGLVNSKRDTAYMSGNGYYLRHDQLIRNQLGDANGQPHLVAGHKKDLILSKFALNHPDRLDFYGFFRENGRPIQGSGGGPHEATYVDYSHGARFISQNVLVNGRPMRYDDVLKSPELCGLLTDEGPYDPSSIYNNRARSGSTVPRAR